MNPGTRVQKWQTLLAEQSASGLSSNTQINQRPRKRFNFENPIFILQKLTNQKVAFVT
jgi:hypothetical protein